MVHLTRNNKINEVRRNHKRLLQYAEYGKCTHEPFLKKASCAPQNRSIARSSTRQHAAARGPINRFAADLQGRSHDNFCQIKSILTSQFSDIISTSLA